MSWSLRSGPRSARAEPVSPSTEVPTAPQQPHLATQATRAFGWSFLNTVVSRLGTLAIGVALARLLGPDAFGTFAVATVALLAVLSFNELGVSLAIVRWREDPAAIAPTVNSISVLTSLLLFVALFVSAPAFAATMGDPGATGVVRLMAVAVVVNGAVATPAALLQREFRQGRRMAIDQVNSWLGAAVSLLLAVAGLGALSLAVGRIVGALVSGALFLRWSPLPYRFGLDRTVLPKLLRFGLPLAGASLVVFASSYADQLVTGAALGSTALGVYVLAYNLSSWPVTVFSQPLRSVAPAALARLQEDSAAMNRAFQTMLGLLTAVALPVCALLAGAAVPLIAVLYGRQWAGAAEVLHWLGVLAAVRICFELCYDYLVVRGRSRSLLVAQVVWLAAGVPALLVGAHLGGLAGVAVAQVAVAVAVMVPLYARLLRGNEISLGRLGRTVVAPLVASAAVGISSLGLSSHVARPWVAGLLCGGVAAAAVVALVALRRADLAVLRRLRSQAR
jgi:O-antigen/teichoic acid export membrane protein